MSEGNGDRFIQAVRELVRNSSQTEVAKRAGISQATISRLVSGQRDGRVGTVKKLFAAYPELVRFFVPANIPE